MARQLRCEYAGAWRHVMSHGFQRQPIFLDDKDRRHFFELLEKRVERCHVFTHVKKRLQCLYKWKNMNMFTDIRVQKINIGDEKAVILSAKDWKKFVSAFEDLADAAAYDRAKKRDDGTYYTAEEAREILFGKKHGEALMVNEPSAPKYNAKPRSKK